MTYATQTPTTWAPCPECNTVVNIHPSQKDENYEYCEGCGRTAPVWQWRNIRDEQGGWGHTAPRPAPARRIGTEVIFTCGRLKGTTGTVVDVRHEGHHIRVQMASGRTVSTRPGAIKEWK